MDLEGLVRVEVAELSGVPPRRDQQVARRIWELVEEDERVLAAVDDETVLVGSLEREAEDAALLLVGAAHVLEAPRSPERSGHDAAFIRTCLYRVEP
jgi:hypothetical protein